ALPQLLDAGGDLGWLALHEQPLEQLPRALLDRDRGPAAGVAERLPLVADAQHERRVAGAVADLLGGVLVERDPVAEPGARRVRGAREEALLGGVPAGDAGVAGAREHRDLVAELRQPLQVRRRGVVLAGLLGEEELRQD